MQISGQSDAAEAKGGDKEPEAVSAPGSEETAAPEDLPADAASGAEPKKRQVASKKPAPKKPSSKKAPPKKAPPKSTKRLLIGLLIKIAVTAAAVWAVLTFVIGLSVHYGNNMYPAVCDGDLVVSFRLQKPFINAAVLYSVDGRTEVGRVIALEGSVVDIAENGSLTVNGAVPSEKVFYATFQADGSPVSFPYTVEPGKVFILNDFREDTNDSRTFGAVDRKDLKGPLLFTMRRRGF